MKEVVTFFLSGKEYGADVSEIQGIENYVEWCFSCRRGQQPF